MSVIAIVGMTLAVVAFVGWPFVRKTKIATSELLCPGCGRRYGPGDRFCAHCGQELQNNGGRS